jgi:hypothetical protein
MQLPCWPIVPPRARSVLHVLRLLTSLPYPLRPPAGFTCQLLQWQKRRQLQGPTTTRMYRIAPHRPQAPLTLVPRSVPSLLDYASHSHRQLDPRGAFLIHVSMRTLR